MKQIHCKRCKYYYVTWVAATPHGCRAFGFTSKMIPSQQVLKNSGRACELYEPKLS